MIRDKHPEWPGTKHQDGLKYIGYWRTGKRVDFIKDYPDPVEFVEKDWQWPGVFGARHKLAAYLNTCGQLLYPWLGTSTCRLCGVRPCTDLGIIAIAGQPLLALELNEFKAFCLTDGTYAWPSGLGHYILEHHVKPPDEFIEHVLAHLPA